MRLVPVAWMGNLEPAGKLRRQFSSQSVRRAIDKRHTWPGNIRELENAVERAVLMAEGRYVTEDDLHVGADGRAAAGDNVASLNLRLPPNGIPLDELERQAILEALRISNWVQKDAAQFLGISSRVMNYKVAKYEIKNPRWTKNKLVG